MKKGLRRLLPSMSIGQVVLLLSVMVMVIAVVVVLAMSQIVRSKAINDLAREEAQQTSALIFESLFSAMRKGWSKQDIEEVIERLNTTQPGLNVRVFRGDPVIREFGAFPGEKETVGADPSLQKALKQGEPQFLSDEDKIRYIYPVKVDFRCQRCHDANIGDVNGVVDITYPIQNLKISLTFVTNTVIAGFVVVLIAVFILFYAKLQYLLVSPIAHMVQVMKDITLRQDLNRRVDDEGGIIREITDLSSYFNRLLASVQEYQEKLEEFSIRDPLTGLFNSKKFDEFLRIEVERSSRHNHQFSLISFDLDNFKHVNDSYGHPIGDLALKELAAMLDNEIRRTDMLARIAGDEFAVMLPETDIEGAMEAAEKFHELLNTTTLNLPVGRTRIVASIGVVTFPENGDEAEKLRIAMDVAMFKAKRLGKNRIATAEDGEQEMVNEVFSRGQFLRRALDEDLIEPFFQPIVGVKDGRPFAFEVLARIREADRIYTASEFIEAAEELGLSAEIDERIFNKAIGWLNGHGNDFSRNSKLFFNLSSKSFANTDHLLGIPRRLRENGIEPEQVVLEITEREALPHFSELVGLIEELRGEGLAFALDDFGSGFSSFLYLKYLNIDYVKIEGSFVRHMVADEKDQIMVEHIHSMARRFGLRTIAEFVEDAETIKLLDKIGVDFGQGYHYGRPSEIPTPSNE